MPETNQTNAAKKEVAAAKSAEQEVVAKEPTAEEAIDAEEQAEMQQDGDAVGKDSETQEAKAQKDTTVAKRGASSSEFKSKRQRIDEKLVKASSIESAIYEYNKTRPVIGLDYLLKMVHKKTIKVYCILCHSYVNNHMYEHVTDAEHQATYIIKHFPKLYKKVVENLTLVNHTAQETALRNIFLVLYHKIEIKHGLKQIQFIDGDDFHSRNLSFKARFRNKFLKMPRYDENTQKFTDAEVNELIRKSNNNISFNQPDPSTLPGCTAQTTLVDGMGSDGVGRKQDATADAPIVKNNETELEKWEKYRVIMRDGLSEIETQYESYEQDPKRHPRYRELWIQYRDMRSTELREGNIDPKTMDLEKEWLPSWERRLRKLKRKALITLKGNTKHALRKSFGLPFGRRTPSPSAQQPIQIRPSAITDNTTSDVNNDGPEQQPEPAQAR